MLNIVGTPIGNAEDTTFRAITTLHRSDIILTEDTAAFDPYYKKIQTLFNLKPLTYPQIVHYHKENEFEKIPWVVDQLKKGQIISLISESGLPTISDPGSDLIIQLIKSKLPFTVIPGPTALTTAAILSGLYTGQLLFLGFLSKKQSHVAQMFRHLQKSRTKYVNPTIVFYESPHRINKTLKIIYENIPDAKIAICREMTKKFEETLRGKPFDLLHHFYKGEITVVLTVA